jgi:hypothetical protein
VNLRLLNKSGFRDYPYKIWIAELSKRIVDGDNFPGNEDYIKNENYSFNSLSEVEGFLKSNKASLAEFKWSSEVDFL